MEHETRSAAERLREFRQSQQLSLSDLAAKLGITKGWLSMIERGLASPGLVRLAIQRLTGISAEDWPEKTRSRRNAA